MAFSQNPDISDCWLFQCRADPAEGQAFQPIYEKFIAMFEHGGYASIWPLKNNFRLVDFEKPKETIEQCYTPNDLMRIFRLSKECTESQPLGKWENIQSAATCAYAMVCKKRTKPTIWENEPDAGVQKNGWKEKNSEQELYEENIQRAEDTKLNSINVFQVGPVKKART